MKHISGFIIGFLAAAAWNPIVAVEPRAAQAHTEMLVRSSMEVVNNKSRDGRPQNNVIEEDEDEDEVIPPPVELQEPPIKEGAPLIVIPLPPPDPRNPYPPKSFVVVIDSLNEVKLGDETMITVTSAIKFANVPPIGDHQVKFVVSYDLFNCKANTIKNLKTMMMGGDTLRLLELGGDGDMTVDDDTPGAAAMKMICSITPDELKKLKTIKQ